jgi:hypothetical protein
LAEEQEDSLVWSEDEPLRTEPRGFSQEQMRACVACGRNNPPTRAGCLYCGAVLPADEAVAGLLTPTLRPLEKWEQGFNVILLPHPQNFSGDAVKDLASLFKLETEDAKRIVEARVPLPLARAATRQDALLFEKSLNALGGKSLIVADRDLDTHQPKRLRAIEIKDDALLVYTPGSQSAQHIPWGEIVLLVAGRRMERRLEVAERKASRGSEKEIVNASEFSADALRLDLYSNTDDGAWRINADNFDFSSLGQMKTLVAATNFQTLAQVLREHAKNAVYDDSYLRVRHALNSVWPLEQNTEALGWRKERMGRVNTEAATTSDNETQLTRYSRLLHYLRLHHPEELKA